MSPTYGYVGTIESETRETARLWFSLRSESVGGEWVKIGANRAWFTMDMETDQRPSHMAQLTLLLEAMRSGLQIRVSHGGLLNFGISRDSYEVNGIRILRSDLTF
ncbi:hypothetical protein VST63_03015 [Mycolicibacterium sp. 050232]|uniref:hypothetical protein n=1 Tax=Mycolicibacterium sp. 050232 TaxID=3113982 RepID=UPI002E2D34EE|nr:hypothetical protein [Mycolicibacterium sp. 050232]MED5811319.1 hypothetical protein [Mycolicibacterium sp. 050232]